jgi:hypothetical protein
LIKEEQGGFGIDAGEGEVTGVGKSRFIRAVAACPVDSGKDGLFKPIAEFSDSLRHGQKMALGKFRCFSESNDGGDILGATALGLLLTTAKHGCVARLAVDVESTHPLRSIDLVSRERDVLDAEFLQVDRHFAGGLDGVEVQGNLLAGGDRGDLLNREEDTGLVVGPE